MFVGVLGLHGIHALAVTGDMSRERQQHVIERYQNREEFMVLCAHGLFVPGTVARKTTVAVIARPTTSPMLFSHMVGHLAGGRAEKGCETLKVVTLADDVPGFGELAARCAVWDHL